jgi:hypothetical protein
MKRLRQREPWGPEELEILRRAFPHNRTDKVAKVLRRSASCVSQKAAKLGLKKSKAYLASPAACRLRRGSHVGAAHWYPKGHVPANKGLRRPGWAPGRMRETQFRKGAKPQTWVPIGTEVTCRDGYLKRKVRDDAPSGQSRFNWVVVHVALWEEHLGPVPPKHVIVFKNGDKADIRIDNLACISQRQNMLRNTLHRYPKEVVQLIQLRGALNRKINRRSKQA